jgi:hypothetical protein
MNTPGDPVPPRRMLHALSCSPLEGDEGTVITVFTRFFTQSTVRVYLRLLVGMHPIATEVSTTGEGGSATYRLEGKVPAHRFTLSQSPLVHIAVQAVDEHNNVLDVEVLGEFRYWSTGPF